MVTVNFESWLIGFIEGEGSFTSNRGKYPVFCLAQKDRQAMNIACEIFGTGTVRYEHSTDTWKYSAYGKACWPVRFLCEGSLQLRKKNEQFNKWLKLSWPKHNGDIESKPFHFSIEDWLIGFIEAEGSFTRFSSGIYPEFSISQNEKEIIEIIQKFFNCGKVTQTGNKVGWQLRITDRDSCQKVRDFCEGRLQLEKRRVQFEGWKKLNWVKILEIRRKEKHFARFAAAHLDGTFFYGVDANGNKTVLNV